MHQILDSNVELAVKSGFLYFPLLFNPTVEDGLGKNENMIKMNGGLYVKGISLESVIRNYKRYNPEQYKKREEECLSKYDSSLYTDDIKGSGIIDDRIHAIVFEVLPYFVRKHRGVRKERLNEKEIIDMISEHTPNLSGYYKKADKLFDNKSLERDLRKLERNGRQITYPADGPISGESLQKWVNDSVDIEIIREKTGYLKTAIKKSRDLAKKNRKYLGTLLYLSEKRKLEIDGFGFYESEYRDDEYIIYKKTGQYALKDFNGDIYLFPNCKIAVDTGKISTPFVINRYKHPFLERYEPEQYICIGDEVMLSDDFSAEDIIDSLETAINTIFYGYFNQKSFAGYHYLNKKDEQENDRYNNIFLNNYKVSRDHEKIRQGKVEIKNDFI